MDGDRRRRAPLKSRHPDLKEKLRQCCLERIKEERNQLLWKIRSNRQQSQETEDIVESTLREIVSDELQRMQPSLLENQRNIVSKNNDVIWEFDGLHLENSTETASEELMLEMQRLLYEDLREELIKRELEFFEKEDEYLAQAVLENMNLNDNQLGNHSFDSIEWSQWWGTVILLHPVVLKSCFRLGLRWIERCNEDQT
nr:PREDICTED: uncharacterized protein LOC103971863 isoform X2 [Musa acuminata subsp. malaccensis]